MSAAPTPEAFRARYGPWALVTGAAQGIGAAFADALAARGLDLLLVDVRADALGERARDLEARHRVSVHAIAADLSNSEFFEALRPAVDEREIGLLVANAGVSHLGRFLDIDLDAHRAALAVNCASALSLVHELGRRMRDRRRGGIILLSSNSAYLHAPLFAHYAATKAYLLALGEALWEECRKDGVDVLALAPGMTRTPALAAQRPKLSERSALLADPAFVVERALGALGRQPSLIPGFADRWGALVLSRFVPRRWALGFNRRYIEGLFAERLGS